MLLFDIGAHIGTFTDVYVGLGYKSIALEPAPIVFKQLVERNLYNPNVIPLRYAVSDTDNDRVSFYECIEDGLSTLNKDWLTSETMPYNGKQFRTITATTQNVDTLVEKYGLPDLMKIDVEGAEWNVFRGMTCKPTELCFEWTRETLAEHIEQLEYLRTVNGYKEYALQYIEKYEVRPTKYRKLKGADLASWIKETSPDWESEDWKTSGLRPTADVGMIWVR